MQKSIIIFDSDCAVCNRSVEFIVKRDKWQQFYFTASTSQHAQTLCTTHNICHELNHTLILIQNNHVYTRLDAVIAISKGLRGWWKSIAIFSFLPLYIKNFLYNIVANNRYLLGKRTQCTLPSDAVRQRLLD